MRAAARRERRPECRQEGEFLDALRVEVLDEAADAPTDPDGFIAWFEALRDRGPGQQDPLFPWLAEAADRSQMRWFLGQEAAGEAGFEDLLAYTQVRMPARAKLAFRAQLLGRDGRATPGHARADARRADRRLGLEAEIDSTVWESLSLPRQCDDRMATRIAATPGTRSGARIHRVTAPDRSAATAAACAGSASRRERRYFDPPCRADVSIAKPGTARPCGLWSRRIRAAPPPSPKGAHAPQFAVRNASRAIAPSFGDVAGQLARGDQSHRTADRA